MKRTAWNKGKSKDTDPRLQAMGQKISESLLGKPGHSPSVEARRKLSIAMSERLKREYADGTRKQVGGYCKYYKFGKWNVQGTWEVRVAKILDAWKTAGTIREWEYATCRIPYLHEGRSRTYIVDFLIHGLNADKRLIEVKGRKSDVDELKWAAARSILPLEIWSLEKIKDEESKLQ